MKINMKYVVSKLYVLLTTKSHNYHSWLARNVKHRMVIAMSVNCKGSFQREKLEI